MDENLKGLKKPYGKPRHITSKNETKRESVHSTKIEINMQEVLGFLQNNQRSVYIHKKYPKTSEWPTFDGKRDSDWVTFLIKIDAF